MHAMLVLKLLVMATFLFVLFALTRAARYAREMRYSLTSEPDLHESFPLHKRWATATFVSTLVGVVLAETMVRVHGGLAPGSLTTFVLHIVCATLFFSVISLLRFRLTGLRSGKLPIHRALGYISFLFYVGMFLTGAVLMIQL